MRRRDFLATGAAAFVLPLSKLTAFAAERRLLYVAVPGIRNYLEFGGVGVLVFDIDSGHQFVKRIPTWDVPAGQAAGERQGRRRERRDRPALLQHDQALGVPSISSPRRMLWEQGARRAAATAWRITPDGKCSTCRRSKGRTGTSSTRATGDIIAKVVTESGRAQHVYGRDGERVYLAGLSSPSLSVADTATHKVVQTVGPFTDSIRPFTVNGAQTLCYVNVNELLGFEIGDLQTGKKLHRVEVQGFEKGPVKRHGCPSHGIGLTPDEKESGCATAPTARARLRQHGRCRRSRSRASSCASSPAGSRSASTASTPTRPPARSSTRKHEEDGHRARGRDRPPGPQREDGRDRLRRRKPVRTGDQFGMGTKR